MKKNIIDVIIALFAILFFSAPVAAIDKEFYDSGVSKDQFLARCVFNDDYPETLIHLIGHAKDSIYMAQYSFASETKTGQRIAAALIAAAKRKVKISIFLNGGKSGVGPNNRLTAKKLSNHGISVTINEGSRVEHAKLVVVDSLWVLCGSTNLTETSMLKNNEANLLLHSPEVAATLERYARELPEKASEDLTLVSPSNKKVVALTDRAFLDTALELIDGAKKEICITTYLFDMGMKKTEYSKSAEDVPFEPNEKSGAAQLFKALVKAHERGVKIRAFIEQSSIAFNEHIHSANMRTTEYLIKKGVKGIRFDSPSTITHSKILISDGYRALLGSTNLHGSDIDRAHQVNFLVTDIGLVAQLCTYFEKLYETGVSYKEAYKKQ